VHTRALLATLLVAGVACSPAQRERVNPLSSRVLSTEREIEITAEVHEQIRAQAPLINDPVLLDYVYEIGSEIAAVTEPQPFIYRFFVIDDDALNAFTIGGGYVYLHSGVIASAGDVNELAGVLAHEIAHVRERHIARQPEGSKVATLATLAAMAAAIAGADPSVMVVAQGLNQSMQIQHTRRAEAEADRSGLRYMIDTGYDPAGMSRFFQRILAAYPHAGDGVPAYLFTHPAVEERVASARVELKRIAAPANQSREDPRLPQMQQRLALLKTRVAGGTGLHARSQFDRTRTDPLLTQAEVLRRGGDAAGAMQLLEQAAAREPGDPRVPLAYADVAESSGDLELALEQLTRAWKLDPHVPLVQYRLGVVHRRLGHRSRAVFFLERAAAGWRPGSQLRRKAELEIQRVEFPVLEESELESDYFVAGEIVGWSAKLAKRYAPRDPVLVIEWVDPDGQVVKRDSIRMGPRGELSARLQTKTSTRPGRWLLRIRLGDSVVEEHSFDLAGPTTS
jgi:predicted Zn-dependent protease